MTMSATVRREVEEALSGSVPGALSPVVRAERVRLPTGVEGVDAVCRGGFPVGAITEVVGPESSGRTTLAASFAARRAAGGQVFAWVDVTDALDPESMAATGVELERMLWVRCGKDRADAGAGRVVGDGGAALLDRSQSAPALGGGGGSPHPRSEVRGMPQAIGGLMGGLAAELMVGAESRGATRGQPGGNKALVPEKRRDKSIGTPGAANRRVESEFSWRSKDREEQVGTDRRPARRGEEVGAWEPRCAEGGGVRRRQVAVAKQPVSREPAVRETGVCKGNKAGRPRPWSAMEQGLRATDLLLQAGGFGVVVLDLGGVAAEAAWRIPMATWFRFRAAAERTQCCFVLLTQHACARSSAELVLEMERGEMRSEGRVMTGVAYGAKVGRQRFVGAEPRKVVAIRDADVGGVAGRRRPPQPERLGGWHGLAAWAKAGGVADVWPAVGAAGMRGRVVRRSR